MRTRLVVIVALVAVLGAALVTGSVVGAGRSGAQEGEPVVRGSAAPDEQLEVVLPLAHDAAGLGAYALEVSDPTSPSYGQYLSMDEIAARFGASVEARTATLEVLAAAGVTGSVDATGTVVAAPMSVATAEVLFATPIDEVEGDDEAGAVGTTHVTPAGVPTVPPALAGVVTGVIGLDDAPVLRRHAPPVPTNQGTPEGCPDGVGTGSYTPNQFLAAYGIDDLHARGITGAGIRLAFVEIDGWVPSDLDVYRDCFGLTGVDPIVQPLVPTIPEPEGETALDTEIVAAVAPGLERVDVFQAGTSSADFVALFTAALDPAHMGGQLPHVLSSSIGTCEPGVTPSVRHTMESLFASAAVAGVTIVSAAGDHGSSDCYDAGPPPEYEDLAAVDYPGASPFVTSAGGTHMDLDASNEIVNEVVWNDTPFVDFDPPTSDDFDTWGGGGGRSQLFGRPSWQHGPGVSAEDVRQVPDIAFQADILPGYAIYFTVGSTNEWHAIGGTSAAAPLFAASVALLNQQALAQGQPVLGMVNPILYEVARTTGDVVFRDVVEGTNDLFGVGCCTATPGFDMASGWGSARVDALDAALAPPIVTLASSFVDGPAPLPVVLDAAASLAPAGSFAAFHWDFEGDGVVDMTTAEPVVDTVYEADGSFRPTVTAVSTLGRTGVGSTTVEVTPELVGPTLPATGSSTSPVPAAIAALIAGSMLAGMARLGSRRPAPSPTR